MSKQSSQKNNNAKQPAKDPQNNEVSSLEKVIIESEPELFKNIPQENRAKLIQSIVRKTHSGPIPDPETLAHYNDIIPNGADRIMTMAEKQSAHRISIENVVISSQQKLSGRGQNYAFIIALVVLFAAFGCIFTNHGVEGTIIGTLDLVALVTIFIVGKQEQKENLNKKSPNRK